jgi:hypothetical protein
VQSSPLLIVPIIGVALTLGALVISRSAPAADRTGFVTRLEPRRTRACVKGAPPAPRWRTVALGRRGFLRSGGSGPSPQRQERPGERATQPRRQRPQGGRRSVIW